VAQSRQPVPSGAGSRGVDSGLFVQASLWVVTHCGYPAALLLCMLVCGILGRACLVAVDSRPCLATPGWVGGGMRWLVRVWVVASTVSTVDLLLRTYAALLVTHWSADSCRYSSSSSSLCVAPCVAHALPRQAACCLDSSCVLHTAKVVVAVLAQPLLVAYTRLDSWAGTSCVGFGFFRMRRRVPHAARTAESRTCTATPP
jgi:hypothetical protein